MSGSWVQLSGASDENPLWFGSVPRELTTAYYARVSEYITWSEKKIAEMFGPPSPLKFSLKDAETRCPALREFLITAERLESITDWYANDREVIELALHRRRLQAITDWVNSDQESLRWSAELDAERARLDGLLFRNHEACRPGVEVEYISDGETLRYVIGGLSRGDCDIDAGVPADAIVLRYRDLLEDAP